VLTLLCYLVYLCFGEGRQKFGELRCAPQAWHNHHSAPPHPLPLAGGPSQTMGSTGAACRRAPALTLLTLVVQGPACRRPATSRHASTTSSLRW